MTESRGAKEVLVAGMIAAASMIAAAMPAFGDESKPDPNAMTVRWKDGLRIETADKKTQVRIGGRIQSDWAFFREDDEISDGFGVIEDGTEFRRARLFASGLINGLIEFKDEFEFSGGRVQTRDVYIGLRGLPAVGTLRVGHFKEPLSLEELTSDSYVALQERSLVSTFVPSRNPGAVVMNAFADERVTAAAGVFRDADNTGNQSGDGEYAVTARVTGLPAIRDDGKALVHLGAAASVRSPNDDMARYRARPEANLAPYLVDTGEDGLPAESVTILAGEAAVVRGPLALQAEHVGALVSGIDDNEDLAFWGTYVQATWWLTGESANYQRAEGVFGGVTPAKKFSLEDDGAGAWQLAARYSHLSLEDGSVLGGNLSDVTLGLNWYLSAITRVTANVVVAERSDAEGGVEGRVTSILTRMQVDF
ncbi:MAG: OprO/OprP family phosphate-selective porin [bacterium]